MASFDFEDLWFGDHGILNIPDISESDRVALLAHVTHKLIAQGHHFFGGDCPLTDEQLGQAINEARIAIFNSTLLAKQQLLGKEFEQVIAELFSMEPMPVFEDGINNTFSDGIERLVQKYGNQIIVPLENVLIHSDKVSCIAETLRTLGRMEDACTAEGRFGILMKLLQHRSSVVRDGAAIGLAYLNDARAIPAVDKAKEGGLCS